LEDLGQNGKRYRDRCVFLYFSACSSIRQQGYLISSMREKRQQKKSFDLSACDKANTINR